MGSVVGWLLLALLLNAGFMTLFGYPIVYCGGALLMSPFVASFSVAKTIALWAIIPAFAFKKWIVVGGLLFLVFLLESGGTLIKAVLSGHLC